MRRWIATCLILCLLHSYAFIEGFKACLFAILGLLGGRAATTGRTSRRHLSANFVEY